MSTNPRRREKICGAARINIARGDGSLGDPRGDGIDGKVFEPFAVWLAEELWPLCAAIVNPEPVAKFIQSLTLGNTADRPSAGALPLYGAQRRPALYEPLPDEEFELCELMRYGDFLVGQRTAMKNHDGEEAQGRKICAMQKWRAHAKNTGPHEGDFHQWNSLRPRLERL
jgi:hypothetical protein